MNEDMGAQKYHTMVKGSCFSFHMPWEDILDSLQQSCSDADLTTLPRDEECVKYMLRLHLKVGGVDFATHLKQVHVRHQHLLGDPPQLAGGKGVAEHEALHEVGGLQGEDEPLLALLLQAEHSVKICSLK